jgi:hypothetical protein
MVLGLARGAAGGIARHSTRTAIAAALAGLVLGAAGGAGATALILPAHHAARAKAHDEDITNDLALALRTHGAIFLAIGAAAGFALGLGLGGRTPLAPAVIGGIAGAALAAVVYELGGALIFPTTETFRPVAPAPAPRLLAQHSVARFVSAGACWAIHHLRLRHATPCPDQ